MEKTPVGHVSDTALWVAAYRALESERPDALYEDALARRLAGERGFQIAREMPYGNMLAWIMAVRTVAIDRLIHSALSLGADTVLNLGAGLDTRPYRLEVPSSLRWIEVDFPALIQEKNQKLAGEVPRCRLERVSLDLSNRGEAQKFYASVGRESQNVLVLTEGVTIYLTTEEVGRLADDLRAVPGFRFWIQDYRRYDRKWSHPRRLQKKLKHAPFRFQHPDPLAFLAEKGWRTREDILAIEEGERLGRKFPIPFPFNWLTVFVPKAKWEEARRGSGFVLLEAG